MHDISPQDRRLYASVDTGFIGQNVYLFCASEGLATVFRRAVDYAMLDQCKSAPGSDRCRLRQQNFEGSHENRVRVRS